MIESYTKYNSWYGGEVETIEWKASAGYSRGDRKADLYQGTWYLWTSSDTSWWGNPFKLKSSQQDKITISREDAFHFVQTGEMSSHLKEQLV